MSSTGSRPRAVPAFLVPVLCLALLAACSGAGAAPTAAGPGSSADPSAIAQQIVATPSLAAGALPPSVELPLLVPGAPGYEGAKHDGQTVLVTASYYGGNGLQVLCDGFLESYPPMPSGNQLGLVGQLPDIVAAQLSSTRGDPGLAQVAWGPVSVIGVFHDASASSAAFLEMQSIRVESGGRGLD
jgi:hypothetical protein